MNNAETSRFRFTSEHAARKFSVIFALAFIVLAASAARAQQFTFMGDYDKTFAAPNGYYVDPQNDDPSIPSNPARTSYYFTGDLNPDGSLLAGGRIERGDAGDFYVRKFTAAGAVDTSFGGGAGYVRTTFFTNTTGYNSVAPQVLKRQPDGKILFAGKCDGGTSSGNQNNASFGSDVCVVRYNADGTLDATFGNNPVTVGFGPGCTSAPQNPCTYTFQPGAGKFTVQSGQRECNFNCGNVIYAGTNGTIYDITLQADGKIVLAGETRDELPSATRFVGILIRLNPNGSLDTTFGSGGIARLVGPGNGNNGWASVRFSKVLVQPDGRIVAAGYDGNIESDNFFDTIFLVTHWTANGQLEIKRQLANTTRTPDTASGVLFSGDGTKLFVSGYNQNIQTLVRFNSNDLSFDATFGTNGIRRYSYQNGSFLGLQIKAIQPDGRILAVDRGNITGVVRLNPDGSPDQSIGNASFDNNQFPKGRLSLPVQTNIATYFNAAHLLLRPDGKINLIGSAGVDYGFDYTRAAVSQQYNVVRNGIYNEFDGDGKADVSVYRPDEGRWYLLGSNSAFQSIRFGIATDKPVPADYDGDGRTDVAVFRDGEWYILQSGSGSLRVERFGQSGDVPRPGDFDGDGKADIAVFRPSNGTWYRLASNGGFNAVRFGQAGDSPVLGDFDGDGRTDYTVFRPSEGTWYSFRSIDSTVKIDRFGQMGDVAAAGDFTGDGRADLAVYRPGEGTWYIAKAGGIPAVDFDAVKFGTSSDLPAPADYDGDGRCDIAVYRPAEGNWYRLRSRDGFDVVRFGLSGDKPVPGN